MLDNAVILRARGAKGNLFLSCKGLDPVKVGQCVTELVERLNSYATAQNKDDVDGCGSLQPQLFDGSMSLDGGRYVMYFRLLGHVWMLVLAPNNGRVFSYQQMRNTVTQLIVHLCKSQEINVDKVKKNYLHIYYGIISAQKYGGRGLQPVLDELDSQLSLVDPKIASGKKPAQMIQDVTSGQQSSPFANPAKNTQPLFAATLRNISFNLTLQDDSFVGHSEVQSLGVGVDVDEDPFMDLNMLEQSSYRRPAPAAAPAAAAAAQDPFAPPPPPVQNQLLSLAHDSPRPIVQPTQDPFAAPAPTTQTNNNDPFALSPPLLIEGGDVVAPVSAPTVDVTPQTMQAQARVESKSATIPVDPFAASLNSPPIPQQQDPFALTSEPEQKGAAPAHLFTMDSNVSQSQDQSDPFTSPTTDVSVLQKDAQTEEDDKSHKFEDLQFELSESWKGEVRGGTVSKAALMGFITISVQSTKSKSLPQHSLKLVVPNGVEMKTMALNPEVGKKSGDKIISLNSNFNLDSSKTASMFRYIVPLSPTTEAPALLRLISKHLSNEKQLMVGVQYTCNPKYSSTPFTLMATLKVGKQFGKAGVLRVAPFGVFDARSGELQWKQENLQGYGILKASFSVEGIDHVDQVIKELTAVVSLSTESTTSFTEVTLQTQEDNINLKIKKKFEMELFV